MGVRLPGYSFFLFHQPKDFMRTLHPEFAYAEVKLTGRERFSSMAADTFETKGGRWQKVHDKKSVAVYCRTQGFGVKQYDKAGKLLAESGDPPPPRVTPTKVVKANIAKDLDWRELELDDAGEQLEAKTPTPEEQLAAIEDSWLAELRAKGETLDTKVGKVQKVGVGDPLMRHIFADDWSPESKVFELQATCRKRGIEFDKSDNRNALIEKLKADDAKRVEATKAREIREGLSDEVQAT